MIRAIILAGLLALSLTVSAEAGRKSRATDDVFVTPNPAVASSPINVFANHLTPNTYHMFAYCGVGLLVWAPASGEINVDTYSCTVTDDLVVLEYNGGTSAGYHEVGRTTVVIQ